MELIGFLYGLALLVAIVALLLGILFERAKRIDAEIHLSYQIYEKLVAARIANPETNYLFWITGEITGSAGGGGAQLPTITKLKTSMTIQ